MMNRFFFRKKLEPGFPLSFIHLQYVQHCRNRCLNRNAISYNFDTLVLGPKTVSTRQSAPVGNLIFYGNRGNFRTAERIRNRASDGSP